MPTPPPVQVQDYEEYLIKEILDSQSHRGTLYYPINWADYGPQECTWDQLIMYVSCPCKSMGLTPRLPGII